MSTGKVWFITGASKGLGLKLAKTLLTEGYYVACTSRDKQSLIKEIGQENEKFLPIEMDLTNNKNVKHAIENTINHFGRIDVLVNNAGYSQIGTLEELSEEMPVLIMPANRPGEAVPGTIRQLPYPFGSGGGGSESAGGEDRTRFTFDNSEDATNFDSGDRVDIVIVITEKDDVLFLPPSAVRDFNGRKFVVVQDGAIQERVDVELGISGNGRLEIISGLEEGQTILGQ